MLNGSEFESHFGFDSMQNPTVDDFNTNIICVDNVKNIIRFALGSYEHFILPHYVSSIFVAPFDDLI